MKLIKHTAYNLIGLGMPLVAAVFTIPKLIGALGDSRFGLLTLIWAVVSYFGLFDLGLGRALTQQLAIRLAKKEFLQIGPLVGTAIIIMTALGLLAGLIMAASAPWGVSLINSVPNKQEAIYAVYAMALAMPFIVLTSGFRGILEACHAFGIINAIRLPMGLFTFIGPVLVVFYWQPRLDLIATVLSVGRLIACAVHAYFAWRVLPKLHGPIHWEPKLLKHLSVSGGWLTVSNIVSPLMTYVDRFLIGAIVSASAVAYYVTPHELITKLWIVPGALTAVLFPTFAAQMSQRSDGAANLYQRVLYWLYFILLPITLASALFADLLLTLWINKDFAQQSARLLQIFSLGMFVTCLANIPFTLIQSADKARITALIHLVELPLFIGALWFLTNSYGVVGAAIAWLFRVMLDAMMMFAAAERVLPLKSGISGFMLRGFVALIGVLTAYAGVMLPTDEYRAIWFCAVIIFMAIFVVMHCHVKCYHNKCALNV